MEDRIKTILSRYYNDLDYIDIFNEGIKRSNGAWKDKNDILWLQLGWNGDIPIFLEKIITFCRQYGHPDLKLIYNDNNNTLIERPQAAACLKLFNDLKNSNLPIDGIGIQCHTGINTAGEHRLSASAKGELFDTASFSNNLKRFSDAGAQIHITECDVHLHTEATNKILEKQATAFNEILKGCIEEPACKSFKSWGFTDVHCWIADKVGNPDPKPLLYDKAYKPKRAYFEMRNLLIGML